jgi:GABA(A) receptor-associated protein
MAPKDDFKMNPENVERLRLKHPGSIPVYITKATNAKNTPEIRKNKFLIPADYTVANVLYIIRKYIDVRSEQGIFLFINDHVPSASMTMKEVESVYKTRDGLIRITYALENTFG